MRHCIGTLFVLLSGLLSGCGEAPAIEGLAQASGTVVYQGQPVEGATVIFAPQGSGRASSSLTDAGGRFQLTTLSAGDGVMPGTYQVAVSKTEVLDDMTEEQSQAYTEQHGRPPSITMRERLPKKYKSPRESGLTAVVTEDGTNDFVFEIVD